MSPGTSPGCHNSFATLKARMFWFATSFHIPCWMKMCVGMWTACDTAGTIFA